MGQPITVTVRAGARPEVRFFDCNRSLTGMAIEVYNSPAEAAGERPPDVLAQRLFGLGATKVTVYSNVAVVEARARGLARDRAADGASRSSTSSSSTATMPAGRSRPAAWSRWPRPSSRSGGPCRGEHMFATVPSMAILAPLPARDHESRARLRRRGVGRHPPCSRATGCSWSRGRSAHSSRRAASARRARSRSTARRVRGRRPLRSRLPRPPPPRASGRRSSIPTARWARAPRPTRASRSNGARSCGACRPIGGRRWSPRCSTASRSSCATIPPVLRAGDARRLTARARERAAVLVALGPWPAEATLAPARPTRCMAGLEQAAACSHARRSTSRRRGRAECACADARVRDEPVPAACGVPTGR